MQEKHRSWLAIGSQHQGEPHVDRARRPFSRPASTKKTQTVTHLSRISLVACGLLPKVAVVWLRFIGD
jgi:hypothetical protein